MLRLFRDFYDPIDYLNVFNTTPHFRPCHQTISEIRNDPSKYQVMLNVKQFNLEEIDVKIVDDFVVIHGKHEEHADEHGYVSREFTRRYKLPEDVEGVNVKSSLSQNGILTIHAPRKQLEPPKHERVVPITIQQPAAVEEAQTQQQLQDQQAGEQQSSVEL